MRGAVAAQILDVFECYVAETYRHMWSEPKKLDDPAVRRDALLESGFDADRFEELVQDPEVKARLLDNTQHSVARGTFDSPTFFVGDEIFFGKDRLREVRGDDPRDALSQRRARCAVRFLLSSARQHRMMEKRDGSRNYTSRIHDRHWGSKPRRIWFERSSQSR